MLPVYNKHPTEHKGFSVALQFFVSVEAARSSCRTIGWRQAVGSNATVLLCCQYLRSSLDMLLHTTNASCSSICGSLRTSPWAICPAQSQTPKTNRPTPSPYIYIPSPLTPPIRHRPVPPIEHLLFPPSNYIPERYLPRGCFQPTSEKENI